MERKNGGTMGLLAQQLEKVYGIGEEYYRGEVKRGLRNSDGTGVLAGVTKVGRVIGYNIEDGEVIPVPGKTVGDKAVFGGLLGEAAIIRVPGGDSAGFVKLGGRIPAPIHSLKN